MTSNRNPQVLALTQALFIMAISVNLTLTGIVGYQLAADKALATLPFALVTVGTALITFGAAYVIDRLGHRLGFAIGALSGAIGGILATIAVLRSDFWLFSLSMLVVGGFQGFAQYYPIAAADSVPAAMKSRAIATVLTGGVIAAIAGPLLANWAKDIVPGIAFAGAFGLVSILSLLAAAIVLALFRDVTPDGGAADEQAKAPRPLITMLRQPSLVAGIATNMAAVASMVLVMTAAPLAAVACSYTVADGAGIIQWHLIGMFAPSFFSGRLVARFGVVPVLLTGITLMLACLAISVSSTALPAFYVGLFSLGVGWNFMIVSGTTLISQSYRPVERAKTQALATLVQNIAGSAAALTSGALLNVSGWAAVNVAQLPILAIGAAAFLFWLVRRRRPSLHPA